MNTPEPEKKEPGPDVLHFETAEEVEIFLREHNAPEWFIEQEKKAFRNRGQK